MLIETFTSSIFVYYSAHFVTVTLVHKGPVFVFANLIFTIYSLGYSVHTWRSGYCYLNEGESNLNQSKHDSFVERVVKNNS